MAAAKHRRDLSTGWRELHPGLPPAAQLSRSPPGPPEPQPTPTRAAPLPHSRPTPRVGRAPPPQAPAGRPHLGREPVAADGAVGFSASWGRREPEVGPRGDRNELCNRQGPQPDPSGGPRHFRLPHRAGGSGRKPIGHWCPRRAPPPRGRRRHLRSGQASPETWSGEAGTLVGEHLEGAGEVLRVENTQRRRAEPESLTRRPGDCSQPASSPLTFSLFGFGVCTCPSLTHAGYRTRKA